MMNTWRRNLIAILLVTSAFFLALNYAIFADLRFISNLLTLQFAFLPISAIVTTIFIASVITRRERSLRLEKMHTLIDIFFSEMGTPLLRRLAPFDPTREQLAHNLNLTAHWTGQDFATARESLKPHGRSLVVDKQELGELRDLLLREKSFLLGLIENPNLLEHESFNELLRALFHLTDELSYREDVTRIPNADHAHLGIDVNRVYTALLSNWLAYMQHLQQTYPYYYSLAVRVNPFNPNASPKFTT